MQTAQRAETRGPSRTPARIPDVVESANAKLVYLYLVTHGGTGLSELQEALGLTKLTLYSVLGTLRDGGVVARDAGRYVPA